MDSYYIASKIDNPLFFQGRRLDSESGLYYFRHRQYDPVHGRFLSRDPLGPVDSFCLYQFVNNSPMNFLDPMGLDSLPYRSHMSDDVNFDISSPDPFLLAEDMKLMEMQMEAQKLREWTSVHDLDRDGRNDYSGLTYEEDTNPYRIFGDPPCLYGRKGFQGRWSWRL